MPKIQPLIDKIEEKYSENVSYDESYGKHSCKQFIKNKPIRFDYKVCVLVRVIPDPLNPDPYQTIKEFHKKRGWEFSY